MRSRISLEIFSPVADLMLAGPTSIVWLIVCIVCFYMDMMNRNNIFKLLIVEILLSFPFQLHGPRILFFCSDKTWTQSGIYKA